MTMIALCRFSTSSSLADHQRGRFAQFDEHFRLTPGRTYSVAGLGIWETVLQVLVRDDSHLPLWCQAGLFDIDPQPIPSDWCFGLYPAVSASGSDLWTQWVALWGYESLVSDPSHNDRLMDRDPVALEIFHREIDSIERGPLE